MIIGTTGRIAAGKEVIVSFLKNKKFIHYDMSSVLKEEMTKEGIEITRKGLQDYGDLLRKKEGPGALIKRLLNKMEPGKNYLITGIRNPGEIVVLRKLKNFFLIGIDSPQEQRFQRMLRRADSDDPINFADFLVADSRDFHDPNNPDGQQVGKCMELVDFLIINDKSLNEFKENIEKVWNEIKLLKK